MLYTLRLLLELRFVRPMPLILTGSASSSRSACVQLCPVIENMRVSAIARLRGASRSSVSDRVLRKYSMSSVV